MQKGTEPTIEFSKAEAENVFHLLSNKDASSGSEKISAKSLTKAYNKYPNILELSEADLQIAMNSFTRELLDDKSDKVESLDAASFEKGLQNFQKTLKSSGKDSKVVYHEIMKICAQLADYNPEHLAELLELPQELNRQDILRLLNSMVRQ
jgi:hypothetical protein